MGQVKVLRVLDEVRVDTRRLDEIVYELGAQAAHRVFDAALEQLSTALSAADAACRDDDRAGIVTAADNVARIAWTLGLMSLSSVAVDLARVAGRDDPAALAAVRSRLLRVGGCSLEALLDEAAIG